MRSRRSAERTEADALPDAPPASLRAVRVLLESGELIVFSHPIPSATRADPAQLSGAEREVLALVLAGRSNAEIAASRGTSRRTVGKQIHSLYKKLGVHSRSELAVRYG